LFAITAKKSCHYGNKADESFKKLTIIMSYKLATNLLLIREGLIQIKGIPMTIKINCWEFRKCGREPNGAKAAKLGICPVSIDASADGLNGGKNGGRICWVINEKPYCYHCEFHNRIISEAGFSASCRAVGTYYVQRLGYPL